MANNEKILRLASAEIEERRLKAEAQAASRHMQVICECPEIETLEDEMRRSAYGLVRVIGMGDKATEYIEKLRNDNLEAQSKIKSLLCGMGYTENYLEPEYTCKICSDTGFKNGRLCKCHLEIIKQLSYENLCKGSPLKISRFEDFDLKYYNDNSENHQLMESIFRFCLNYAENFDTSSYSILMMGETGLGKTHLSLAIAGKVLEKGYGVIYGSVQNLFSDIEKEHFGRGGDEQNETEKMLLDCDLLILDDLGAEFTTSFTVATVNNIINTRLLALKPTIISTNLTLDEIGSKYSKRIASRLIGEYQILTFRGKDIRQQKLGL